MSAPKFSVASLSPQAIEAMTEEDRKLLGLKTRAESAKKRDVVTERQMQREVEAYLRQLGYWPRSPAYMEGSDTKPPSGWYVHVHAAKKNPILLDLLILEGTGTGAYLELELKVRGGKLRPAQLVLAEQGAPVFYNTKDACAFIKAWHDDLKANT